MTQKEMEFAVFCIENLAEYLGENGADVYAKLSLDSNILDEYIIPNCAVLHTQGKEYIINDITDIMREEGLVQ